MPKISRTDRSTEAELARLQRLARLMDASIGVPGTPYRLGLDPILGLLPGVGDAATTLASLWIVYQGWRLGARKRTLLRMFYNVGLDLVVGAIPVAGDLFDVAFKANRRNVQLLEEELRDMGVDPAGPGPRR